MRAPLALLALLALLVLLAMGSCAPADPAGALLDEYRARMARVLDVELVSQARAPVSAWPRKRERTFDVPLQRTGLGQFLSLHRCDLGALVGERSSQLGRVMTAPERLSYEHRFLLSAENCLARLGDGPDRASLREALTDIVATKRAQLPLVVWNATFGSDAMAASYALDVAPLAPADAASAGRSVIAAVHVLTERISLLGEARLATDDWSGPWSVVGRSRFPGSVRRSVLLLTVTLDEVAERIEMRQAVRPMCPERRSTVEAEILRNVFTEYYAKVVQPYLVAVHGAQRDWLLAIAALRGAQEVTPPPPFERFATEVLEPSQGEWQQFIVARDRHTRAWQDVLDSCSLAPRPPGSAW